MITKTALFGGTFDPIHNGHIEVAQFATEKIGADKVILVPANRSPFKSSNPQAGAEDRIKMISLAIAKQPVFEITDCEIKRPEPSYTYDTVQYFRQKYPAVQFYLLMGADSLKGFSKWYKVRELIDICNICVMFRAGEKRPEFTDFVPAFGRERVEKLRENVIKTPLIDISSTEIRNRIASAQDVTNMLHPDVLAYIKQKGLYK